MSPGTWSRSGSKSTPPDTEGLVSVVLQRLGSDRLNAAISIVVKEQGISGYAGILVVPGDIRILVKPITDLQQELALYHELGHAITHALNEEEGIFKTWTSSYDEAMTVVIERIAALIVLDDAQRKVAQNLWLLEATRCATSALCEFELWDQPDTAEGLYRALLRGVGYRRSACWCLGCRLISIELIYKPGNLPHVHRPLEDEMRRDVICPHCTLDQTVFGLATWCFDCGTDIFLTHVSAETAVTRAMLQDVNRRQEELGKRVAAKDLENCLEDAVSIFEASVKAIVRRALSERGEDQSSIEAQMKKIGNSFQSIDRTRTQLTNLFNFSPTADDIWKRLGTSFEKRHSVSHNLGVVDRKYLERVQQAEREGREVRVSESEVASLLEDTLLAISDIHKALVGASK